MISALISRAVAVPAGLVRWRLALVPEARTEPALADQRANRAYWWRENERIGPDVLPPIELRTEDWPVQLREEMKTLADLTAKHDNPWEAACEMDWSR